MEKNIMPQNGKRLANEKIKSSKLPTSTGVFDCHSHIHLDKKKIEQFLLKSTEEREKKNYKTFYYEGIVLVAMEENEWGQVIQMQRLLESNHCNYFINILSN